MKFDLLVRTTDHSNSSSTSHDIYSIEYQDDSVICSAASSN